MKKCDFCDEEYEDHLDVCPDCGMKLEKIDEVEETTPSGPQSTPSGGAEGDESPEKPGPTEPDQEDVEPSEPDQEKCPNCGTINPPQANYCIDCSTELGTGGGQPAGPQDEGGTPQDTGGQLNLNIGSADGETILQVGDRREEVGREDLVSYFSNDELKVISRRDKKPQKKQFEIIPENGKYYILDENSANGTWVNGENIKGRGKKELSDGDVIKPANQISLVISLP